MSPRQMSIVAKSNPKNRKKHKNKKQEDVDDTDTVLR